MPFHCTLVRGPQSPARQEPAELTVEIDDGGPGSEVQAAVAARFGTGDLTVKGLQLSSLTVGRPPLMPGAVLVEGAGTDGAAAPVPTPGPAGLHLLVHSGHGAGLVVPLERGTYSIGRANCGIAIPDPDISRAHALLTVSETSVSLRDNGSSNGVTVNGRKVRAAVVSTDSLIQCGSSLMTVVFDGTTRPSNLESAGIGTDEPLRVPRRPEPAGRANMALMAGLPLLLGVVLAITTGTWMFLAFTGISAVSVLVPMAAGRRERRAFKSALRAAERKDRDRRQRAAPSAADIVLAVSSARSGHSGPARSRAPKARTLSADSMSPQTQGGAPIPGGIALRIGTGRQHARIELDPQDPGFESAVLQRAPVTLDPLHRDISVAGRAAKTAELFNFLLMQLAAFPSASSFPVIVHGPPELLPLSARFLPQTMLCSDRDAALESISRCTGPGFLFLFGPQELPDAPLREAADAAGWTAFRRTGIADPMATIGLGNGPATLRSGASLLSFDADFVAADVFDSFCRIVGMSTQRAAGPASGLPVSCSLGDLLPWDAQSIRRRWEESKDSQGLQAVIGRGELEVRTLDLVDDGPHMLVAGTTGAGKSELLRTVVAALCLTHSPERVNFLFVDFKGGSGLGPLATLPHCVGLLTDLKRRGVDRALASLRAEVRWREQLLAEAGVEDLVSYQVKVRRKGEESPGNHRVFEPLPRLVIVIDEFRMLIEDSPSALTELMRIATVGRSLGIHLIMATQRPQGAISSDIRANVTTSIALRVQSEMESRDVIDSPQAAGIPISLPGRAYLSRGAEGCELFQTASLSGPRESSIRRRIVAHEAAYALENPPPAIPEDDRSGGLEGAGLAGAGPAVEGIRNAWSDPERVQPRRPVAAELPESIRLRADDTTPVRGRHATVPGPAGFLGVVDLPDEQSSSPLIWRPEAHGHLALLGPPGSGVEDACLSVSSQLLSADGEVHCYILDGDGTFPGKPLPPLVGAVATIHEPRRAVRVAERIADELAARQGAGGEEGVPLLLVITAWGSWLALFRSGPLAWAEDLIHGISRDGPKSGIHLLVTGDRELTTSRLFGALPNRAYFPYGSTEENRAAWPRFAPLQPLPARAMVGGPFLGEGLAEAQFAVPPEGALWPYGAAAQPAHRVFRVEPLPRRIAPGEAVIRSRNHASAALYDGASPAVLLGLGGDELGPVGISLPAGAAILVLGHRGTGKSNLLDTLPLLNPGIHWLRVAPGSDPVTFCRELHSQANAGSFDSMGIALIDDIDRLGSEAAGLAAALPSLGVRVIATATRSQGFPQPVPLVSQARDEGRGILLSPRHPADGELFGVRVEPEPNVPGRAVLIQDGESQVFQIPLAESPGAEA